MWKKMIKIFIKLDTECRIAVIKIEIKKQRTDVKLYMNCSNFSAFPLFFSSEKVKLDSFVVAAATAPVSAFAGLS